ncbi:type II toxin-antitoxin system HipA family toxin [Pigmentiphaga sp. H8]|uniref:type II toxin-antitoxin system HipA family toxin n=1 Tax=Pigmentiphaga sp. H8 TaxID=2488560 RepID=UPI000F5A4E6C|nr:type II toxin-antitoxin system HipA family toxin [Pigmentiphaga sp. H8]AZG11183.1 type II toxin-antitoxin system HipA family toxin [Pigmentiphaga sp. H8]
MGRPSQTRALDVWANGIRVGQWRLPARGADEFLYDDAWAVSPVGRPLSLSLPVPLDPIPLRGAAVRSFFDNLLPDSDRIRQRIQTRFRTAGTGAFDLLAAIGRDCVGAVQLLPEGEDCPDIRRILAEPLGDADVERILRGAAGSPRGVGQLDDDDEELRISIAGAQEKTALLWHEGRWCRPLGATPTTHIFKLPLGLVGNRQADMRTSVENEWLCAQILSAFGVPAASCRIGEFGEQKVLIVERFDRRLADGGYWLRLPQEDFCQACGVWADVKYEADGGPGLKEIAAILANSDRRDTDLRTLLQAQLLFWLLAATDGHAKNFSIHLLPQAHYQLTPLYDVLSAWPVIGKGANRLDYKKLKLAMALPGKNKHYKLAEVQRRHFNNTARLCGYGPDMEQIIGETLANVDGALEDVGNKLPAGFPADVFESIASGMRQSAARLAAMPS